MFAFRQNPDRSGRVLSPTEEKNKVPCWRAPVACAVPPPDVGGAGQWERCLACPVFKACAENDPEGWNAFVSRELRETVQSDRRSLENDLRMSEMKYRRIFEGSKDMIFVTDRDGSLQDVNQACVELLGYASKEDLLSLVSVAKIYDNPMHWEVFKKQIDREGFVKDFEAGFRRKDGTRLHCLLSGNAVNGNQTELIGYEGIAKDITARMDAIRSLRKRHQELSLLHTVALVMNGTQNLDDVLTTALRKVLEVLNLSRGGIFLVNQENATFCLYVQKELCGTESSGTRIMLHDAELMEHLLKKNASLEPKPNFPSFHATVYGSDGSTPVSCFLITARDRASGFIALHLPADRSLTEYDHHLLGSLGNFLGGAIENTRLLRTIHRHREELQVLTARLFQSHELERRRISRELHDEAGQALSGISFLLESIDKHVPPENKRIRDVLSDVKKKIHQTYEEIRRLSYHLHPAVLSDLGLEPALDSYLSTISKHTDLEIEFKMIGFEQRPDPEIETVLYRISQEAFTNTLKHSKAKHFKLSIIKGYPHIIFVAEDDGVGFDAAKLAKHRQALGLLSMRERAAMLGGNFSLQTSPGNGTRIRIEIPVKG